MKTALSLTLIWILLTLASIQTELCAQIQVTCTPATGTFSTGTARLDYNTLQFLKQDDQIKVGEAIGQYLYYGWAVIDISQIPDAATITSLTFSDNALLTAGLGNDCRIVRLDADPVTGSGDVIVNGMSSVEFVSGPNYMMQNGGLMTIALNSYAVIDFQAKLSSGSDTWLLGFYEYGGNDPYGTMQGYTASQPHIVVNYSCNAPLPTSITGSTNICEGDSVSFTANGATGASAYNWTLPNGWAITAGQGTATIQALAGADSGTICVAATNTCGSGLDFCETIGILSGVTTGTINGPTNLCEGEQATFIMTALNATGANWTIPTGWSILTGQGTLYLEVIAGTNGGLLEATPFNDCGGGGSTDINLFTHPVPEVTLSAQPPVCLDDPPVLLTAGSPAGGVYSGVGVNSLTSMFDPGIAGPGTHSISYEITLGPCSDSDSTTIFVDLCAGMDSNIENSELTIIPNPNNGNFTVLLPEEVNESVGVEIIDLSGRLVHKYCTHTTNGQVSLRFNQISPGIYYLRMNDGLKMSLIVVQQ